MSVIVKSPEDRAAYIAGLSRNQLWCLDLAASWLYCYCKDHDEKTPQALAKVLEMEVGDKVELIKLSDISSNDAELEELIN